LKWIDHEPGWFDEETKTLAYYESGLTEYCGVDLMFYKMDGCIGVACPKRQFRGTLITGSTLGDAIETWYRIYERTPELL
jgi:hypothetical protein